MNQRETLLNEVMAIINPKLSNVKNGTATNMEVQVVRECLGFRSLILSSALSDQEIRRLWDNSNLAYM